MTFEQRILQQILTHAKLEADQNLKEQILILLKSAKEGHFCTTIDSQEKLPPSLCAQGSEEELLPGQPLVAQGNRLYLQKNWAYETLILRKMASIWKRKAPDCVYSLGGTLNESQKKAVAAAFTKMLTIITGGPGTGKTYTASHFIRLLAGQGPCKVILTAPTGKAAAHLEASLLERGALPPSLQLKAMTLHRLLQLQPGVQRFLSERTIDADLVVVDEASMLDASLFLHLFNAIGPSTRLLLLGDANQLPPIEGSGFFAEAAELLGQKLDRSIRMGDGELFDLSATILRGDVNIRSVVGENVEWISWAEAEKKLIEKLCSYLPDPCHTDRPDPAVQLQALKKKRVLSILRKGPFGTDALNRQIFDFYEKRHCSGWLVLPILITKNDSRLQLYNGMQGILFRHNQKAGMAWVDSSEGIRSIPEGALPGYEIAFCLSVHKSQGSEFEEVMALFPPMSEFFGKEALYTAATRAKKKICFLADEKSFLEALQLTARKRSGFLDRAKYYFDK